MFTQSLYETIQRYRTLRTHVIKALPLVVLAPHSACNCRCVMCDIWKDNKNLKQLNEHDIRGLLLTLKKFGTRQVLMTGGEALLHQHFFKLCQILRQQQISISLLSTGIALKKNAGELVKWVDDVIVSLDGHESLHDEIRNIRGAFRQLEDGIRAIRNINPRFRITARTVIHKLNFRHWATIIDCAKELGLSQVSFLPADVSSHAFNRQILWNEERQQDILPGENELPEFENTVENIIDCYAHDITGGFIAENGVKLRKIYSYYAAAYGKNAYPFKKCNAPWVSVVVEADGNVRPCFFHPALGNIRNNSLEEILNSEQSISFRKRLDMDKDPTCVKCVCYLNLRPGVSPSRKQ